jgi:hypothetical protein
MLQRNAVKKRSKLTKKRIVIIVAIILAIIAAIAFFVRVPMAAMIIGMFLTALLTLFFPVLSLLPISTVLSLTFAGFVAIAVWAFYKQNLKPVLFPGSVLVLPALVAAILMVFSPTLEWYFTYYLLLPLSAIMLSIFVGLGSIVVSPSYRQDLSRVLKLITFTFGAIVLSIFFQLALLFLWALALRFIPGGTELVTGLVIAYLYWHGEKRGLFLRIFGPVLALELALFLTINLIIL